MEDMNEKMPINVWSITLILSHNRNMAIPIPTTIILSLTLLLISTSAATTNPATSFIESSCRVTTYPIVCVQSLSPYASVVNRNERQLVLTALSISVDRAELTKKFVAKLTRFRGLKPREYAAIKDCYEEITDSVDRLSKSIKELKKIGRARGPEFEWHMSNLETWVSAALTDDGTCLDGFAGRALNGRIKNSIRTRMTNVAQVTSNALALSNKFGQK